ncbi:MAG TPA: hypothetical protein VN894_18520 [Polyangiaceae bacterium]|nr:hypothetical protein [Polyangiaceae bacterium]
MELPAADALRWIVRTYARLRAAHGEAIGAPALVQPTAAFFPDEFRGDAPSVARLLRRIVRYAPIADDLPIELAFVAEDGGEAATGCGSIACGSSPGLGVRARGVEEREGGYRVFVATADVAHADLLTTSLARSVGALVLSEAGEVLGAGSPAESAEVAAVACGFGILLANGAAVWAKSCGGLRVASATALTVEMTAVALALFASVHGVEESEVRAHLRPTQREALDLALGWTASNPLLVDALRDRPAILEAGAFDIEPPRGLLGRWLHKRKIDREMQLAPIAAKPARSADQVRRLEEARALVDEVLGVE